MRNSIKLFILLFLVIFSTSCALKKSLPESQTVISPLGNEVSIKEGSIVYGLPITVLKVIVEMERTIEKPGPYARYAGDLLGLNDVITDESESWSIDKISIESSEELDPSEFYVIESTSLFESNMLRLKKEGFILDLNPEIYKNTTDRVAGSAKKSAPDPLAFYDLGSSEYYQTQMDTAFRLVNYDASFVKVPYLVEKKKKLTTDQLAERAAKTILELRDGKHLILTGEANVYPQNSAAIDEINRLDREYTELFAGKTFRERKTFSYTIIPGKNKTASQEIVFRFSELTGPADASEKSGVPVTIEINPAPKNKGLTLISKPEAEKQETQQYDKLFYRVPEVANIFIKLGDKTIYSGRNLIFQSGEVIQLPANYLIGK
jgi:hypothetical protein